MKTFYVSSSTNIQNHVPEIFILQNLILRTRSCVTGFITQSGWACHFHQTTLVWWKWFVPQLYLFRRGISGGPPLNIFTWFIGAGGSSRHSVLFIIHQSFPKCGYECNEYECSEHKDIPIHVYRMCCWYLNMYSRYICVNMNVMNMKTFPFMSIECAADTFICTADIHVWCACTRKRIRCSYKFFAYTHV